MNKIRQYVLNNSLTWSGVHLVFDQWYKQPQCVGYFTKLVYCSNYNVPEKKVYTCVRYSDRFIEKYFYNLTVNKTKQYFLGNSLN